MYSHLNKVLTKQEFIGIIDGSYRKNKTYENFYGFDNFDHPCVIIDDVTIDESIELPESFFSDENIIIKGGKFNKSINLGAGLFKGRIEISGGQFGFFTLGATFWSYIQILGGSFNVLRFSGGYFKWWVRVAGGKYDQIQLGGGSVFEKTFSIENCELKDFLLHHAWILDAFEYNRDIKVNRFLIGNSSENNYGIVFINKYLLLSNSVVDINIRNSIINEVIFKDLIIHKDSKLYFSDNKINKILFINCNNHGYISFKQIINNPYINPTLKLARFPEISRLERPSLENLLRLDFIMHSAVKSQPKLSIMYSNAGKIDLIGCDLTSFKFEFAYSKITELFLAGTNMPASIQLDKVSKSELYEQQRLGYSQIKKIYESRGDTVESGNYYAKEMDAHFRSLNYLENFWEKINLWLSKISSFYGQSWKRGIISLFTISIILFILYCRALGYRLSLPANESSLQNFFDLRSFLPEFMNPIHKAEYIPEQLYTLYYKKKIPADYIIPRSARILDILSRIIIGYFLYQFIQAFRRYGKKGS
ncbi:hypothetical protein [Spirosoma panaciterrae]|uniref:hypothetical protein n=1 Tax=Spirosoma panaciterrae TaxID=496058 RepID=UPI000363B7A5|nr:hypothetical protein [Spirosoma panaciterrae]